VGFEKLANAFDSQVLAASSLRRIQRFIAEYILDSDLIAKLIFGLLPHTVFGALSLLAEDGTPF